MRAVSLVLVCAACSGSGDGAVLSFTAPEGPAAASRIEVVLASAATDLTATRQRMRTGDLAAEDVVYYRQRSHVDAIAGVAHVDGLEVRIQADETIVPDEAFIPFALIYDEADVLIAVGTVNDENGIPTSVMIKPGVITSYDVTVLALEPDDAAVGVKDGQGHAVMCKTEATEWRSGAAWKSASGPQIRLLLPDVSEDAEATDAMLRDSDLDCDDHAAEVADAANDCDDLRGAYHPGQTETCDGQDTDCDGRRLELIEGCQVSANQTCSATGVSLCAEGPNDTATPPVCVQNAACGCALVGGTAQSGCAFCSVPWVVATNPGTGAAPCTPAAGKLHFVACEMPGCTLEVVGTDGPWEIKIGPEEIGPFSTKLTGIRTGYYFLRAKYLDTATFAPNSPTLGAGYIAITPVAGRPTVTPINLDLDDQYQTTCGAPPGGNNFMRCMP